MQQCFICTRCWNLLRVNVELASKSFSASAAILSGSQNYYDLLKVAKDAEQSDIKAAYIELSKTLHPDKNLDKPNPSEDFIELNTAYEILSKTLSRRAYDQTLHTGRPVATSARVYRSDGHEPFGATTRGTGWYTDFPSSTERPEGARNYYGIKGVDRVGNILVMYGCVALVCVTGLILFSIFKHYSNRALRRLDAKDQRITEMYNDARSKLRQHGNKKQLEIMRQRHKEIQRTRAADLFAQK